MGTVARRPSPIHHQHMIEDLREPNGNSAEANLLRKIVRNLRALRLLDGPNYRVVRNSNGQVLEVSQAGFAGQKVRAELCDPSTGEIATYELSGKRVS